jgi:ornithine decarboxylase
VHEREAAQPTPRQEAFLAQTTGATPYVVVDLDVVAERYRSLAQALPMADIFYAIKANPAAEILELLVRLGASFDVASPGEVDLCLAAGASPERISYGNTVKKRADIAYAFERGVRLYTFDSDAELDKLIAVAPGCTAVCRVTVVAGDCDWPLTKKFGTDPADAVRLLTRAASRGLGTGISFHVGSQQRDPSAWDVALADTASVFSRLRRAGVEPDVVNIGGGFPASSYVDGVPPVGAYGRAITRALHDRLGAFAGVRVMAEPGRYLVGDAGVMQTEVVLVAERRPGERWVYLDIGLFGGLAETLDEAIHYRIRTPHDGSVSSGVAIAGPTCDSADVLYEKAGYLLPEALAEGDRVQLMSTGAYTTTYSSVGFNGFSPLRSYYLAATS